MNRRLICIQTEGKSNKSFFYVPRNKHKKIENISSTDDVNDKSPRTNDSEVIASLFEAKYKDTYSKKVIDEKLLKDIMAKMNFSLSESHIKILKKR